MDGVEAEALDKGDQILGRLDHSRVEVAVFLVAAQFGVHNLGLENWGIKLAIKSIFGLTLTAPSNLTVTATMPQSSKRMASGS